MIRKVTRIDPTTQDEINEALENLRKKQFEDKTINPKIIKKDKKSCLRYG